MEEKKRRVLKNMDGMAQLYIMAGRELGCDYEIISTPYIYKIKKGKKEWLFFGAVTPINPLSGGRISDNKKATKRVLKKSKIPITQDFILNKDDYKKIIREKEIYFPVVLKPLRGTVQGYGVVTNICSKNELLKAARRLISKGYLSLLAEEYLEGMKDYRVLVFKNRVVAATLRLPAFVVGDGKKTIKELIEEKNEEKRTKFKVDMGQITVDDNLKNCLRRQGYSLGSVPYLNKSVQVKTVCNLGQGGEGIDVTHEICSYNKNLAVRATKALGLKLAGLDFLCKDISKPLKRRQGVVIEVNESPGFKLQQYPTVGRPRNIARMIVQDMIKS